MRNDLTRRDFISGSAKIAVACCFLPSILEASEGKAAESASSIVISLDEMENFPLKAEGGAVYVKLADGRRTLIVWNHNGAIKAFSSACTHKGVKLDLPKNGQLACPAHGAIFDFAGKPVKGPAKSSLKEYKCSKEGNEITISLKD